VKRLRKQQDHLTDMAEGMDTAGVTDTDVGMEAVPAAEVDIIETAKGVELPRLTVRAMSRDQNR
jgi:hypothetical protein